MKKIFSDKTLFIGFYGIIVAIVLFNVIKYIYQGNRENVNTAETRKFISSIMKSDSNIDKEKIFWQNGALQFDYTVKNEPTKDELTDIFDSSYNFMINYDELKDSVIKSGGKVCFNINYKDDRYVYEGRNFVYDKMDKEAGYTKTYNTWRLTKNNVNIDSFTKDYLLCEE